MPFFRPWIRKVNADVIELAFAEKVFYKTGMIADEAGILKARFLDSAGGLR